MSRKRLFHKDLLPLAEYLGPDDGHDPRFDRRSSGRRIGRKTLQLCAEVSRTLNALLAESDDDVLRDLQVQQVQPAPNEARLLVTLALLESAEQREIADILTHMHQAAGYLRSEIAFTINRRRAPELIYQLMS